MYIVMTNKLSLELNDFLMCVMYILLFALVTIINYLRIIGVNVVYMCVVHNIFLLCFFLL